jgi:hypothetical protein
MQLHVSEIGVVQQESVGGKVRERGSKPVETGDGVVGDGDKILSPRASLDET